MSKESFRRVGAVGVAVFAVAALVTGCNSSKKAATAAVSTVSSAAAATAAAGGGGAVVATGGGKFCQEVASSINSSTAKAAATGADATSLKAEIQSEQAEEAVVIKAAPSAIKGDLNTLFGASNALDSALAAANYDYTKLNPTVLATTFNTPAVATAETNIQSYLKNTCGIDEGDGASAAAGASAAEASALAQLSSAEAQLTASAAPSS